MKDKLIYVVDDEENIRELIRSYLLKEGYEVMVFGDGGAALESFRRVTPDMLIIDIMMPVMDGYSLCREIRKSSDVPIIMVSAKDDEIDRVLGLEMGSDDYISKPFSPREMIARVKTIFRRIKDVSPQNLGGGRDEMRCQDILILIGERRILKDNVELELTAREFDLIQFMVANKNRVFTREQLIESIWGYDYMGESRSIDDLIKRIRKKLQQAGSILQITTVWGYGYKISDVEEPSRVK